MSTRHAITLLTGPAAAGKSQTVMEALREPRRGKALVVVPSALQKRWLRERADDLRRVVFRQFYGLADQVLKMTGEPPDQLDEPLRFAVVRALMHDLAAAGRLPTLRRVCGKSGFVAQVIELVTALQENRADPAALAAAAVSPYDGELAAIYASYLTWQEQHEIADVSRRLALARTALDTTPGLFNSYGLLVIDGFDQFTPVQLSLISALTRQIPQTIITLTYEGMERPALRRFIRTYQLVQEALDPVVVPITPQTEGQHPTLRFLADQLFTGEAITPQHADGVVLLVEAADREREVRAALRQVKRLITQGTPPEQIGILLRDGSEYSPLLREVAAEYQLPLALAEGLPLGELPVIAALLGTLRLPVDQYPRRSLIDAWRARGGGVSTNESLPVALADPAIDWNWAASLLDRVARAAGISAGYDRLRGALLALASLEPPDDEDDQQRPAVSATDAAVLLALLDAFAAWLVPPEQAPVAVYTAFVRERTAALKPIDSPEGDQTTGDSYSAWGRFERVLHDLERTATLLHSGPTTYAAFLAELSAAVATARYGRAEPQPGYVAVLPVLAARGSSFAHVVLLGMNEGEFPRTLPDPPLYSRRERGLLRARGVPITTPDPADEQSLFYEALARARDSLILCRTYLDPSGNPLPPSPYLRAVEELLIVPPHATIRSVAGSVPSLQEAASPTELLVAMVEAGPELGENKPLAANHRQLWTHIQDAIAVETARESSEAYGAYEGIVVDEGLLAALGKRFGPQHRWSVTQLNDYITCPFLFFGRHVLQLGAQEEPEAALRGRVARTLRGRLDHAVLAETVRRWQRADLKPLPEHEVALLHEFDLAATTVLTDAPERFGFTLDRFWSWDANELRRRLARALRRSLTEGRDWPGFNPAAVEQSFGYGNIPPLRLDTSAGPVLVMGRIDRIDQRDDGALAVIDYKSGSQPRSLRETLEGRDVQLPIYLHAVEQVLPIGQGQHVDRAAFVQTGSGKRSTPLSSAEREQATAMLHERVAEVVGSVREGLFTVRPRDTCPDYCVFVAICRVNLHKGR